MGKLHLVPFEDAPVYELSAALSTQAWFAQRNPSAVRLAAEMLVRDVRNDNGLRILAPGDAFRLIVAHRRDDIWSAICRSTPPNTRRTWNYGAGLEYVWNHDLEGFCWFATLPGGPGTLAGIDLGTAIEQAKVFCKTTQEYTKRQEILSLLIINRPNFLRNNPTHWDYIVHPPLSLMQLCAQGAPMPAFCEKHFAHMRPGMHEHFQMLLALHGQSTPELWNEMRRFAENGPAAPGAVDNSYAGVWSEPD